MLIFVDTNHNSYTLQLLFLIYLYIWSDQPTEVGKQSSDPCHYGDSKIPICIDNSVLGILVSPKEIEYCFCKEEDDLQISPR